MTVAIAVVGGILTVAIVLAMIRLAPTNATRVRRRGSDAEAETVGEELSPTDPPTDHGRR